MHPFGILVSRAYLRPPNLNFKIFKAMPLKATCFFLLLTGFLTAQTDRFSVTPEGKGPNRCWLVRHAGAEAVAPTRVVVFLHGFGATNPGCYGGWIEHLLGDPATGAGHLVIYPKFQTGLWPPRGEAYTKRIQRRLETILEDLQEQFPGMPTDVTLIGHSIGGVIAANLADRQADFEHFSVNGILLTTPGHKVFPCGRQSNYERIPPELPVVIVTGEEDGASGDKFALYFTERSPQLTRRIHLSQQPDRTSDERVRARHRTPVSPLPELYQSNFNLITIGARLVCRTDLADRNCYFRLSDALLSCAEGTDCATLNPTAPTVTNMGKFSNGTPVAPLLVVRE